MQTQTMRHIKTFIFCLITGCCTLGATAQDSLIYDATIDKAWDLKDQDHADSALILIEALLPRLQQDRDLAREGKCYNLLGLVYRELGQYDQSYRSFKQALDIRRRLGDKQGIASVYNNVASVKILEKRYVEASDTVGQAILLYQELRDSANLAKAFVTLSNVYQEYRDFETAAVWLRLAIETYHRQRDTAKLADAEFNFGNLYYKLEKLDSARVHYQHALSLYQAGGDILNEGLTYNMMAAIYLEQHQLELSRTAQDKAENLLQEVDSEYGLFKVYVGKGTYMQHIDQPAKALPFFHKAYQLQAGTADMRIALIESMAEAHRDLGHTDSSIYYEKLAVEASESLFKNDQDNSIVAQHIKKWQEKKVMQQNLAEQASSNRSLSRYLYALIALLLLLAAGFYYRHKENQRERRRQLQIIKGLTQNLELNYVNARLEGQQAEKKILGRDLHDRIGAMMATLKWRYEAIGEKLNETPEAQQMIREANHTFGTIYQELRSISHQLESEGSTEKVELLATLQQLCADISKSGKLEAAFYVHGLEGRLDYKTELNLLQIIREIVANALKHSEARHLTIQLTKLEQHLTLMVEDDGKGFDLHQHRQGAGIRHLEERVAALGGTIQIDSAKNAGVTTIIEIPLSTMLDNLTIPSGHDKTNQSLFGG